MTRSLVALLLLALLQQAGLGATSDQVFEGVVERARTSATAPFQSDKIVLPDVLQQLNYDTYRMITFRQNESLWFHEPIPFQVQFFHPGYLYDHPVAIHVVADGKVRPIEFSPKFFRYPRFDPAPLRDAKLGFAGFRILYPLNTDQPVDEIISFIGSSYFRALAARQVYGISARGLAVDTAENMPEEFPAFREFWLCRPAPKAREMQFFALLESPRVSGAYRFLIRPGKETTVEIEAHLFFRKAVRVLGIAPLTSMFWRDDRTQGPPNDVRPEVHDSDTLIIESDSGEKQFHPLHQVGRVTTRNFPANDLRGFGLLQRDRNPAHYRDSEAKYSLRPSVFVQSLGKWGEGSVRLLQLPATNEYNDNLVAFWEPLRHPPVGTETIFKYRLHWFTRKSNKP